MYISVVTLPRTALMTALCALACCGGGEDAAEETFDFAGLDLSVEDLAEDVGDASRMGADLTGYDLTCDPGAPIGGGDPVGSWSYYAGCAAPEALYQLQATCSGIAFSGMKVTGASGSENPSGVLQLFKDGTFKNTSSSHLYANAVMPSSCYAGAGSCSQYGATQTDQYNWLDMKCHTSGAMCLCVVSVDASIQEDGTWARTADGFSTSAPLNGTQSFTATATTTTMHERGDAASARGKRGITYVLIR